MKRSRLKSIIIILSVFVCGEVFSQNISDFTQVEHHSSGILENESYRNQNLQYVTAESTKVYSNDWELVGTEKKNITMENCSLTITLDYYVMIGKDNHWMNADDLYIRESSLLPKEIVWEQDAAGSNPVIPIVSHYNTKT